jgi:hypothetical protein
MRVVVVILVAALAQTAHADTFAELAAGLGVVAGEPPLDNGNNRDGDLSLRVGTGSRSLQAIFALDYIWQISADPDTERVHRVDARAGVQVEDRWNWLRLTARVTAGFDVAQVTDPRGNTSALGLVLDPAVAVWMPTRYALGLELSIPMSRQLGAHPLDFTSVDVLVSLVLRVRLGT